MRNSGILTHYFSVYTLFHHTNCAKREEHAKQRGIAEQLFYIYPAGSKDDPNMPTWGRQAATARPKESAAGFGQLPSAGAWVDNQA